MNLWVRFPPPEVPATEETLSAALDWARTPLVAGRPAIALVTQPVERGYSIYDYVIANLPDPPSSLEVESLTQLILQIARGEQLLAIGTAAYQRQDMPLAEKAWVGTIQQKEPLLMPPAMFGLGLLLKHKGHLDGAKTMFEKVVDTGHFDAAPRARNSIAQILADEGDAHGALAIFEELREGEHPLLAAWGAFEAGLALERKGDRSGAEEAYRQAVASGHPDAAPRSAVNLGILLHAHGDYGQAVSFFQQAIDSGHHEQAPKAYRNLAVLRRDEGDLNGAEDALQAAITSGHPDITPSSLTLLGRLRAERGRVSDGISTLREALAYGTFTYHRPEALLHLALLLERQGETTEADRAYLEVIDSADPTYVPAAYFHRGVLLAATGDRPGAMESYRKALEFPDAEMANSARYNLAVLLDEEGSVDAADILYEQASASDWHSEVAAAAAVRLGMLREHQGEHERARVAYERGVAIQDPEHSPSAAFQLGSLIADNDPDAALPAFEAAVASGQQQLLHISRLAIAVVRANRGEDDASREMLRLVFEEAPGEVIEGARKLERALDGTEGT